MKNKLFNIFSKEEITISDILKLINESIKKSLLLFISILLIFFIYSIIDFSSRQTNYKAEANVRIDGFEKTNSSIEGLSSLFGNKIQSNTGKILGPEMFGEVINSKAFLNDLVITKIPLNKTGIDSATLESYFYVLPKLSIFQKIKTFFFNTEIVNKDKDIKSGSIRDDKSVIKEEINTEMLFSQNVPPIVLLKGPRAAAISEMESRIEYKFTEGKASVFVKMPDPLLSAIVTKLVLEKLIDYVTKYKTKKQIDNLNYIEQKYNESQLKYKQAQLNYASYKDASLGVILQSAQSNDQILNNNSTILFNIYNQFALQLEQAKFELKKETPMFFILEPITIPESKSEPSFISIVIKKMAIAFLIIFLIFIFKLFFSYDD